MVKEQASRRKSIAVAGDQNRPVVLARKRRAHSIVPGDVLSPRAKARRFAVPRKSILKSTFNLLDATTSLDVDAPTSEDSATRSIDLTAQIHDNTTRKSLGRRVSFAKNAHVRLIALRTNDDNTNSTASPPASPAASSDPVEPAPAAVSDENAYPGAAARNRRRSSIRHSLGSDDMDLTVTTPGGLYDFANASALANENLDFDDSMDMDMTEDLDGEVNQGRAISLGGNARHPLAQISVALPSAEPEDQSQSFTDQSYTSDPSQDPHTEYTVPINRSLRPPPTEDPAWMALRQMTHSGNAPYEDAPPSSDDEFEPFVANQGLIEPADASFSSTDDSFSDANNGDRTMNLSQVMGRVSMAGSGPRFSMGQPDSTMDESEVYGSILPPPGQSTPAPRAPEIVSAPARPSIFRPPSPSKTSAPVAPATKAPKPVFFPPQAAASTNKRPREGDTEGDKGTPVKRLAVAGRWTPTTNGPAKGPTPQKPADAVKPKSLSPSKKAPFLVGTKASTSTTAPPSALPRPALRRPSSYFGRRKSMTGTVNASEPQSSVSGNGSSSSPRKTSGLGIGRASMGSAPSDAWKRFDKTAATVKGKEKQVEPDAERQATASPIPSGGSAAAPSPRAASPRVNLAEMGSSLVNVSSVVNTTDERSATGGDMDVDPTEQWREGIQQAEPPDEDVQPISIEQFFELTNVKFMDALDAPRRSIHQPSRQARPPSEISLAEYGIAMAITVPELDLYSKVSNDLQAWMDKIKEVFKQEEEAAAKIMPQLFTEYLCADEEDRAALLHQLDLIRSNVRSQAKSEWYDWKLQWIDNLRAKLDEALNALHKDMQILEQLRDIPDQVIPGLEREYDELMRALEQEQAEVAEIENCNQDYLNELKASIAEQDIEVEALKAELAEHNSRLQWLQERTEEMEEEKRQAQTAIAEANRFLHVQQNSTHAELTRLKEEIELLQDLHMLRITKVVPELFEYEYAAQLKVSIPCRDFAPVPSKVKITRLEKRQPQLDDFPELTKYFFDDATRHIPQGESVSARRIVASLSDYWSSCAQLRSQLFQLTIKYPLHIEVLSNQGFRARTTVMFPAVMGKAFIYFIFSPDVHGRWPMSIDYMTHEVQVVFGALDQAALSNRVSESLGQAGPMDNDGCLLDACIYAQELYAN
ncbi:Spc7 kinetochore protein-domain-containing protein [Mycena amicta]|nr:Spc7 kinetochore protein-domain-containing protein [Mycena amicta]